MQLPKLNGLFIHDVMTMQIESGEYKGEKEVSSYMSKTKSRKVHLLKIKI